MEAKVTVVVRDSMPERMVAEAEVEFSGSGPLAGMKLVGFSVWKGEDGDLYATFPSRAFGAGSDRRYFDFLRPIAGYEDRHLGRAVKDWIVAAARRELSL